ncbi:glycoside hydrolase family 73 protein [Brevibacillus centrosporus]|uniref:glycoside hydrolase family 73 protein n=1 Tax=Brevibacillus centrosporus TaxID=54910 RepID=UPI002E1DF9B4|nr:glucosaminidase domain-containing protein [Brevibacillus centrosporus]MED1954600.1 glucosaminidase domain-containing protein [Brevibacillus centrosporus]
MPESKQEKVIQLLSTWVVDKYPCPSGVIAQLIQECGWDLKTPKDMKTGKESFNLGNIKGTGPAGHVTVMTHEYYNGKKTAVIANFRAYNHYGEAIDDHFALLKKDRYVNSGVWKAKTPREYAEALKRGGYATDPNYVTNIMKIVDQYKLTRFDPPATPVETIVEKAVDAVMKAIEDWKLQLADKAIDSLSQEKGECGQFILQNAEDWKKRLRSDPQSVLEDLPWLVFVLVDRANGNGGE